MSTRRIVTSLRATFAALAASTLVLSVDLAQGQHLQSALPDWQACYTTHSGRLAQASRCVHAAAGAQESAQASGGADEPAVVISSRAVMQTPSGYIATAPLDGLEDGSHVVVHGDGTVAAHSPAGDIFWKHPSLQFTRWTGRQPPDWVGAPATPEIHLGVDPFDPYARRAGAHPFTIGDLTGDGIDDVAAAHFFFWLVGIAGDTGGTLVSVLDGATGDLVWSRMYPGFVNELAIGDGTLVLASETGDVQGGYGQNGSVSTLEAWKFVQADATIQAGLAWSFSTEAQWARWLALEKLPGGQIAVAWTGTELGSGSATPGRLLTLSLATGATQWSVTTAGYPRFLRLDASRNRLVAIEEADPLAAYAYSIVARNLSDGAVANTLARNNATALGFQAGDLDGDGNHEWVVADLSFPPCLPDRGCVPVPNAGRIAAIDAATGVEAWSQLRAAEPPDPDHPLATLVPRPYGLELIPAAGGADVLVGSFMPGVSDIELERLAGATGSRGAAGSVLWSRRGANLFLPSLMSLYRQGGRDLVRVASSRQRLYGSKVGYQYDASTLVPLRPATPYQVIRSLDAATGADVSALPLLGRIHAVAGATVNADGVKDLVVGGESAAVFALDGTAIGDQPTVLWRRTVAGPVHQITAMDLDGDGRDEIVVAASHGVDVLESASGDVRYTIPLPADFIWSVTIADVNGDGAPDIVVPASTVAAYAGNSGALLWRYVPSGVQAQNAVFSNAIVTPDRFVVAQFAYGEPTSGTGYSRGVVGLSGANGASAWSASTANSVPQLWRGTAGSHVDGVTDSVVGFTWIDTPDVTPTLRLELRDAATGVILNSLPPPSTYAGNMGTLMVPGRGVVAYGFQSSWQVGPTEANRVLGNEFVMDLAQGTFGALGTRVLETRFTSHLRVLRTNGLDPTPADAAIPSAATFTGKIDPARLYVQDLDDDGSDEVIRVQWDWDGYSSLVAATQGFGYAQTLLSDGLDILEIRPVSTPPIAGLSADPSSGNAPLTVTLDASGSTDLDPGDFVASYTFDFGDGSAVVTQAQAAVQHSYANAGVYTAAVTVEDSHGLSSASAATVQITVTASNRAPVADAGEGFSVDEGQSTILSGAASSDPDNEPLSYAWTQIAGPAVALADADAATTSFAAPSVSADTALTFRLAVTDPANATSFDDITITVRNLNLPPEANAGLDFAIEEGRHALLDASDSGDPDGDVLAYGWTQIAGLEVAVSDADTAHASFAAPSVSTESLLTFRLTVRDPAGATSVDDIIVTVFPSSPGTTPGDPSPGGGGGGVSLPMLLICAMLGALRRALRKRAGFA